MTIRHNKDCSICVYNDGIRADGTWKCCTPERQRDQEVIDCCIPERNLRELQRNSRDFAGFINVTTNYITKKKAESIYWTELNKTQNKG